MGGDRFRVRHMDGAASRMKMAHPHRVPLSDRAVEILEEARQLSDDADQAFPSPTDRRLSDGTLSKLVRENGIACVPHGMRGSFRTGSPSVRTPRARSASSLWRTPTATASSHNPRNSDSASLASVPTPPSPADCRAAAASTAHPGRPKRETPQGVAEVPQPKRNNARKGKREISAGAPSDRRTGREQDDRRQPRLRPASFDTRLSYDGSPAPWCRPARSPERC